MHRTGPSPRKLGLVRPSDANLPSLTEQVVLEEGSYWFGTQLEISGKLVPGTRKDGADPRKHVTVKYERMDYTASLDRHRLMIS
jgi:hypothetical protein